MMKQMRFKWKYLLASILLANNIACSDDDLSQMVSRQEHDSGTRTAELVTQTIKLEAAGTLEAKVSEAMGDSAVSTLEKLVLSGPFTSTDMQYVRDSLTGLMVLDMDSVQIKASDVAYKYGRYWYYNVQFEDNKVCKNMFYQMDNLKEVILPSTITSIGDEAFYDCDSLRTVVIPDKVSYIGNYAFYSCNSLTSVKLPLSLKALNNQSFYGCTALSSVVIPDSVTSISSSAFSECYSLQSITLPSQLKTIGYQAFNNCDGVQYIELPDKVETIDSYAFQNCDNLRRLTVPAGVTSVGSSFVRYCSRLRALVWKSATVDVPDCSGVGDCFLFVESDQIGVSNLGNWKSIIINGVAESTINIDFGDEFANVKEFKAKKLAYSRNFVDNTQPGGSAGWQTIVLPFTPDSIYHETKGQIAPFGSGIEGAKPFWLRELTDEGFVDATTIEPNKPYIIAMPNHDDYLDEYRLNGTITFVARDSVLRVTPEVLEASVGPEFEFHPTYRQVSSYEANIYTITSIWNYYEEEQMHYSKSFFEKYNWRDVYKFNAYVTTLGGGRSSRSMFDLDTRSKETRAAWIPNKTGIPQIGDM